MNKSINVTLFGATGFVGRLTAEYLASHAPEGITIALAGRNRDKLTEIRDLVARNTTNAAVREWPLIVADSFDATSLHAMAEQSEVIISTVGPYGKYGEKLVEACAEAGTHYVDLCGEVLFMRRSADKFHEAAKQSGARIVHACGFDSVPSDLGMLLLHEQASLSGEPLKEAAMLVKMKGGLSGGTIESMRVQTAEAKESKEAAALLADPYSLSPDRSAEPSRDDARLGKQPDFGIIEKDSIGAGSGWAGPFLMAGSNTRVVRRSNALLGHEYGSQLRYREFTDMGEGLPARIRSYLMAGGLSAAFFLLNQPKLRPFLSRWVPEPGDGPSKESRESGFFRTTHYGSTASGKRFTATVETQGDPGYKATSMMLAEAALTLAVDQDSLPPHSGGVLTPAVGLGQAYVERLRKAGMALTASDL